MLRQTQSGRLGGVVPLETGVLKRWMSAPEERRGKREGQEKQDLHKRVWRDIEDEWHLHKHMHAHIYTVQHQLCPALKAASTKEMG